MREACPIFIELDVEKALKDGMEFFLSKSNAIVSAGLNGIISPVIIFKWELSFLNIFFRNISRKL